MATVRDVIEFLQDKDQDEKIGWMLPRVWPYTANAGREQGDTSVYLSEVWEHCQDLDYERENDV